jgi:hypothetical protein
VSRPLRPLGRRGAVTTGLVAALAALAAAVAGCDAGTGAAPPPASDLRVLHAIFGGPPLDVVVDGRSVATRLGYGELTRAVPLTPAPHELLVATAGCDTCRTVLQVFTPASDVNYAAVVVDSAGIIDPVLVADLGAAVPPGRAMLRLADFAAAAPAVDAYRTQPDSAGLRLAARALGFRTVTAYVAGAPGDWTVVVSPAGARDTLLATGPLPIASGEARTVVLLDSTGGGLTWRLVPDRP